jgi:hypothetical protein
MRIEAQISSRFLTSVVTVLISSISEIYAVSFHMEKREHSPNVERSNWNGLWRLRHNAAVAKVTSNEHRALRVHGPRNLRGAAA